MSVVVQMCLAMPGKVIKLKNNGKIAVIDYGKEKREAANVIKARVGDFVLVQHKVAVEKVDFGNRINAIVFDLGGVLVGFKKVMVVPHTQSRVPFGKEIAWDKKAVEIEKQLELGNISFKVFYGAIVPFMKKKISYSDFVHGWKNFFVYKPFVPRYLKSLKKQGYKIGILSNTCPPNYEAVTKKYNLGSIADFSVASFEVHLMKPDKRIFKVVLEGLKENSENCVFIDDVKKNTDAARELGFKAIKYENFRQLKKELAKLGINA